MLRALCREHGVTAVDFGIGDAQYKQMLCDASWDEAPLRLFAPTLRGRWLRALLATVDGSARLLRRALDRAGLTQRLKQRWRRRLAKSPPTPPRPPGDPSRTPPGS
jgi:CelD/BcsL family acetyltransferase involved in cellulose biosynthesis